MILQSTWFFLRDGKLTGVLPQFHPAIKKHANSLSQNRVMQPPQTGTEMEVIKPGKQTKQKLKFGHVVHYTRVTHR